MPRTLHLYVGATVPNIATSYDSLSSYALGKPTSTQTAAEHHKQIQTAENHPTVVKTVTRKSRLTVWEVPQMVSPHCMCTWWKLAGQGFFHMGNNPAHES